MERPYFNQQDVDEIERFIGRAIAGITYYHWQNHSQEDESFTFLYAIELQFSDKGVLLISSGDPEEQQKLCFNELVIAEEQMELENNFNAMLSIEEFDANHEEAWEGIKGETIIGIEADFDKEQKRFYAEFVTVRTMKGAVKIQLHPQGDGLDIHLIEDEEEL
jgi:hypothetical protein